MRTKEEAIEHFRYKAPNEDTLPRHQRLTEEFIQLLDAIWDVVPDGPGKTFAIRKLSDARMAFNSAIANNGQ